MDLNTRGSSFDGGPAEKVTDIWWTVGCVLITAIATFLRFFKLDLRPFHHDEGVNGFFLTTLFNDGVYKYDPANYHGPTLYYITLAFAKVFGLETIPVRASVAIFGVLTVVLAFFLKRYIGKIGSLFAALFLALSPGIVFISRYFIHEIFFVFLSLALVIAILFFIEKRRAGIFAIGWTVLLLLVCFLPSTLNLATALAGDNTTALWSFRAGFFIVECVLVFFVIRMLAAWNDGRPIYLILASACAVLLFATKETAFITLGTMLIAVVCVWLWRKIYRRAAGEDDELADPKLTWSNFRTALGDRPDVLLIAAGCAFTFIYLGILFFSSFFTYADGVKGAFEAHAIWSGTGSKDHTQNGMWAYFEWGMKLEGPILILSAVGTLIAFIKARHSFAMFAGLWAFGLLAAYTIIPYKTPWLALSFLLPMCIIAGYGINELITSQNVPAKALGVLSAAVAATVLAYQTYELNFVRYDDGDMPYVYAHTKREFLEMVDKIKYYADKSGKGTDAVIEIVSPDYWPMPWYFNDYEHANFHGRFADTDRAEIIVAKKDDQDEEAIRKYSANYLYAGSFPLRPGVDLVLLVRKDLADADAKELYRIRDSN